MRALVIIVLILVLMVIGGWLVVNIKDGSTTVEVRTDKIKEDTSEVVEQAGETFKQAGEAIGGAMDRKKP